jgi:predicted chitinase
MRLGLPEIFPKLARTICQFPNEWDKDTIVTRYKCLKEEAEALEGGTVEGWQAFEDHLKIMAFDTLPAEFKAADWHFHPAEFIRTLRKCTWLSEVELAQTVALSKRTPDIESVSSLFSTELKDKGGRVMRPSLVYPSISFTMRKYGINTSLRMAHWFGQILQETGTFAYMRELGDTAYFTNYYEDRCKTPVTRKIKGKDMTLSPLGNCDPGDGSRFSGKGLIQLTGGDNYRNYQAYRGAGNFTVDPGPETLITNAFNACDAGGYYWSSKQRMQKINGKLVPFGSLGINYWTEKDTFSNLSNLTAVDAAVHDVTKNVNPGLDGLDHRQTFFKHAFSYLSDMTDHFPAEFKPLHHQEKK